MNEKPSINQEEFEYLLHMNRLLHDGYKTEDRTGTGTLSLFHHSLSFNLRHDTLPVITTKKVHLHSVIHELLWFISGNTNIQYLKDNKVRIWDEWADGNGDLGPVYGHQWRNFDGTDTIKYPDGRVDVYGTLGEDQLQNCIDQLRYNPDSRRIIVNSWNPNQLDDMALPPCHMMFQFKSYEVMGQRELHCNMYQRSADWFLGVPFNITSYALLVHMVAKITNHVPVQLNMIFGDTHLYNDHLEQARIQVQRFPHRFPTVELFGNQTQIDDFVFEDIIINDYNHHDAIKGKVSV